VDAVNVLLDRFEKKYGVILWSKETNEIAVRNFLRHSIIKGGSPVRDCLIKEMKQVKNQKLIQLVFSHIKGKNVNETINKLIVEYETQNGILNYSNEKNNDNENENENDVSYHDSYHDSSTNRSKPTRHKYGLYENVLFTDEDFEKLKSEFPNDYMERIERLSEYIASTGKKYKNHLATIRAWARKDKKVGANGIPITNEKSDLDGVF
jgi:hypothetical protein